MNFNDEDSGNNDESHMNPQKTSSSSNSLSFLDAPVKEIKPVKSIKKNVRGAFYEIYYHFSY